MNKKISTSLMAGMVAFFNLTGIASAESVKWKLANPWPEKHPGTVAVQSFLDDVRARTNGTVDIEIIFLRSVGYKQGDLLRVLKQNVAEVSLFVPYYISSDAPYLQSRRA